MTSTARRWARGPLLAAVTLAATLLQATPAGTATTDARVYRTTRGASMAAGAVAIAPTPSGRGYWRAAANGAVRTSGDARYFGSAAGRHLAAPVVDLVPTPTGKGYWLATGNGRVFPFGDAYRAGSLAGHPPASPVVGMAATPSGKGYWLVTASGRVFDFGDAARAGSIPKRPPASLVVAMAASRTGEGYWLVTASGRVFNFGDAPRVGSLPHRPPPFPIVGMAVTPSGKGYWLAAADGGIFSLGDARFYGSAGACPGTRAVDLAATPAARGYWLTLPSGRTYAYSPSGRSRCVSITSPAERLAKDIFDRANAERAARGLPALRWDTSLAGSAANWSREMAASGFRHSDLQPLLADGRFRLVGENIAWARGGSVTTATLHVAWMRSDGHRANLLAGTFETLGVGVYCGADGAMWATQQFGRFASSGPGPAITTPPAEPVVRTDPGTSSC